MLRLLNQFKNTERRITIKKQVKTRMQHIIDHLKKSGLTVKKEAYDVVEELNNDYDE